MRGPSFCKQGWLVSLLSNLPFSMLHILLYQKPTPSFVLQQQKFESSFFFKKKENYLIHISVHLLLYTFQNIPPLYLLSQEQFYFRCTFKSLHIWLHQVNTLTFVLGEIQLSFDFDYCCTFGFTIKIHPICPPSVHFEVRRCAALPSANKGGSCLYYQIYLLACCTFCSTKNLHLV